MSYIGNKPMTQAEKKTQQHAVTASKTVYPVSGGYTAGLIDAFLNGVLLLDGIDYTATDGLSITLMQATAADDTLVTIAWGSFAVADVVQPNDPRLATAWGAVNLDGTVFAGTGFSSVESSTGNYDITFDTPMDINEYSVNVSVNSPNGDVCIMYSVGTVNGFSVQINRTDNQNANGRPWSFQVFGGKN